MFAPSEAASARHRTISVSHFAHQRLYKAYTTFYSKPIIPLKQKMWTRYNIPTDPSQPFTDYSLWRLRYSDAGDQTWHYLSPEESEKDLQPIVDKYWLGTLKVRASVRSPNATTF